MIRINKNNIVYHSMTGGDSKIIDDIDFVRYLTDEVRIAKGVTFKRIFDLIILHKDLLNLIMDGGTLRGYEIEMYLDEYNKEDDDKTSSEIDYLELCWNSEYWDFDGDKELSCYPNFHGICENFTDDFQKTPCRMNIGLDFTPVHHWKKYVVRLDNHVVYQGHNKKGKTIKEKYPILIEGKTYFQLFDLISAILHEMTFYGNPKQRDEKSAELNETSERIKSGEEKMFTIVTDENNEYILDEDGNIKFEEVENPHKKDKDK